MWSMISWSVSRSPASLRRVAELGEEIVAGRPAPRGNLAGEELRHELVALDPAPHRGAGQGDADDADRRRDHVDERLVDRVRLGPPRDAEERRRGKVEGQRLDRGIEFELGSPTGKAAMPRAMPLVQRAEIVAHRLGLERDRQRLAVGAVVVEVEQHQPARKHTPENRRPAELGREVLVLVEQDELVGLGADQPDVPPAEIVDPVDPAEFATLAVTPASGSLRNSIVRSSGSGCGLLPGRCDSSA